MAEESKESTVESSTGIPAEVMSALADQMVKPSNPLNNPLANTGEKKFVSESFFKPDEAETVEDKDETIEDKTDGDIAAETKVENASEQPVATADPVVEEIPEQDFVGLLNQAIGDSSFNSIQEVRAVIEENKKFKAIQDQLSELTQEERARIELGREYGDFGLYDRISGIDTLKITPKEALKQVYLLENIGKNAQFLDKVFERDYAKTYAEDEDDPDFHRLLLDNNGQEAIQKIVEMQEAIKQRGQISGAANPEDARKAKEAQDKEWIASVDKVMSKNDRVSYDLGDGVKINIVTDAKDKHIIQDAMDKPVDFLKSLITDEKGNYDHEALFEFIVRNVYYAKGLEEARKAGAAVKEEKFLKEKKNSDVIITPPAGDANVKFNPSDELVKGIRAWM